MATVLLSGRPDISRSSSEKDELSLDLLQGLTGVLAADSRPERAVDVIRGAEKTVARRTSNASIKGSSEGFIETEGCDQIF